MSDHAPDGRTIITLSTGARVGAVAAAVLLIVAAYLLWSPIQLYPSGGFPIQCGTALSFPADDLGKAACGDANIIRQWQAAVFAAAGAVVALGSVYAFGIRRHREPLMGSAAESDPVDQEPAAS